MNKYYSTKVSIFVFSAPALILFSVFCVYPLLPEIWMSLNNHDGFRTLGFVGLDNYKEILASTSFWTAHKNTYLIVGISVFLGLPLSLMFALFMDVQTPKLRRFFKTSAMLPAILSVTVVAEMWISFYEPTWGLFNSILRSIGLEAWTHSWLTEKNTVMPSIGLTFLWQYIGLNAMLFYTGIKTIPKNYYEAALIDGASFAQVCLRITIPLLQDVTKYVLILSTLGSMAFYSQVRVMTAGGPGDLSRTVIYQMYYVAFETSEFGKGTAIAVVFILECLFISFLIQRFVAREKLEF
ncbi:ABC-type sugar transport system permease subunit [Paenibacillus sp. V4I3]|uniref:carbohydrate ABC transporter permease n=1 Tax=Paenibacillus sp. V4I3 TaxID=3042305 RepID=UPI00278AD811|nr:sugar ABC transporter permease [Paenibacillus sp. V4I3]MDQ0875962.1 ABC-type sugar transport system permease subunit [Paenibacillus sp. V4I3]